MFYVKISPLKNRLYMILKNGMDQAEFKEFMEATLREAQNLKPGFSVSTDISEFAFMNDDMVPLLNELLQGLKRLKAGNVVRIINPQAPNVSLQWQRASWKLGYTAEIVTSGLQAEEKLDELDRLQMALFEDAEY